MFSCSCGNEGDAGRLIACLMIHWAAASHFLKSRAVDASCFNHVLLVGIKHPVVDSSEQCTEFQLPRAWLQFMMLNDEDV